MKRRQFTAEYKTKIVIEILQGEHTIQEIASREEINLKQLQNWKTEFLANASRAFAKVKIEKDAKNSVEAAQRREDELMRKVGQLTIENDWLKKKSEQVFGSSWEDETGFSKR